MAEDIKDQNCELKAKLPAKYDWYQTEQAVVVTVLVKNVKEEFLKVNISESIVRIDITLPDFEAFTLSFSLSRKIVPDQSSYKLTPSKVEIKLKKLEGVQWDKLEGTSATEGIKTIPKDPIPQLSGPPSYPTSKKGKDWSAVEKEIKKQEELEKPEGEEAINKLFQEIYGKGSDEVKRAMNKSYMESGGTVLSTNWDEISKEKVQVKPPDGMEFKKWHE
ncbi:protein SGT1 homolog [Anoplophora glabripennis]|uniref:Suppressor of G2 allele of SKP1 n=1 Tax=Anoplophora glabripennis TaxID=217634 RepID=V5GVJ1_ANOGL|nr:protein SGT1 homolog [Anoplophora glabripennis]